MRRFAAVVGAVALSTFGVLTGIATVFPTTAHASSTIVVNTTADTNVFGPSCTDNDPSTLCSFRQALTAATTDGDIVQLQAGATYLLVYGELQHDDHDLTIEGNGATVDGQSNTQALRNGSGTLTVNDLTITNGYQSSAGDAYGGGLYAGGDTTLDNVSVTNSKVRSALGNSYGGGVYAGGTLTINDGAFTGNTAETDNFKPYGGGIAAKGTMTVTGATVTDNHNVRNGDDRGIGGGIFGQGLVAVVDSTVTGNTSMDAGGIGADGAVDIIDSVVSDNSVDGIVGGVMSGVELTISGSQINGNVAGLGDGTGVNAPTISITGSQLVANKGGGAGGAVKGDTVTIASSTIAFNESTVGGGVWAQGAASLTSTVVVDNVAYSRTLAQGGGVWAGGDVSLQDATVTGNVAQIVTPGATCPCAEGGGVYSAQTITLDGTVVDSNTAVYGGSGGGLFALVAVDATNSTIVNNVASIDPNVVPPSDGGGIAAPSVALRFVTVAGNTAAHGANVSAQSLQSAASVVANPQSGADCAVASTSSAGYSYDDDGSCGFSAAHDVSGGADPMLGPLADNGGPTPTMHPLPGSPLVDAIPNGSCTGCVATDQRGITRPQGRGYDIGAVEVIGVVVSPRFTG